MSLSEYQIRAAKPKDTSYKLTDGQGPLPTVVWVYGGGYGSQAVRTFGFEDQTALWNMHVLPTRGYAILFPDAPITEGMPVKSLVDSVLPAVDAAIAQGYADPTALQLWGGRASARIRCLPPSVIPSGSRRRLRQPM
jgi:dipeptidyl aminopeptidase/acylaminoacyl peptidase